MSASPITQAQWSAAVLAHSKAIRRNRDPNPTFLRHPSSPSRASLGIRPKTFVCASPSSQDELSTTERSRMGICLPRRHDQRFHFGPPSLPNWQTIVVPAVRYAAKGTAGASSPMFMAKRGIVRAPRVRGPSGSSTARPRVQGLSRRIVSVSTICTVTFGSTASICGTPTMPKRRWTAALIFRGLRTAGGYCEAARGRTIRRSAAPCTATALRQVARAGRAV
jgi:hypothetical protein